MKRKLFSLRTKIEAVLAVIIICSVSVYATRTITDTSDTVLSTITTSLGGSYAKTTAGLQAAINATNGTNGIVNVPPGYFDVQRDFSFYKMTLKCSGSGAYTALTGLTQINLTGNNTLTIGGDGSLQDVKIYCPSGHGDTAIRVSSNGEPGWSNFSWQQSPILKNVYVIKVSNTNGTAINITAVPTGARGAKIALSIFENINIRNFKYGIVLFAMDVGGFNGYINGNIFKGITLDITRNGIVLMEHSTGEIGRNLFDGVIYQCSATTEKIIYLYDADNNDFKGVKVFDYTVGEVVNLSSTTYYNSFEFSPGVNVSVTNFDDNIIEHSNVIKTTIPYIVYLPEGEIQLDNFFSLSSNTKYVGAGIGRTILHQNGFGVTISSKKNITFSDLTIHGNGGTRGIQITGSSNNITIKNVEINGSSNGIELDSAETGNNIIITECLIHGCTDGIDIEAGYNANHTLITDNVFYSNTNNINDGVLNPLKIRRTNNIGCYDFQLPIRAPEDPIAGMMWINSTTGLIMYYAGVTPALCHIHVNAT